MASRKNKQKIRTDFKKNRVSRPRAGDLTRQFQAHGFSDDDSSHSERISGKGELTRKRTVVGAATTDEATGLSVHRDVDRSVCLAGRVLSLHGLVSVVQTDEGRNYRCAVCRILKTLNTDQRN